MNIFLGDEITLMRGDVWITGKVNGIKLDKGHLSQVSIEGLDVWFAMELGWKFVDESEDIEIDD